MARAFARSFASLAITVTGGSANYVEAILLRLHEVAAGAPVSSVRRVPEGVLVAVGSARPRLFDAAVIATHPGQTLLMLVTPERDNVLVTYDVTRLMRLAGPRRFLVTLGGSDHVDPATVLDEMTYSHPVYTPESVAAQQLLPTLNDDRVVFAGAYHGWGFHEDGAASGLAAARRLGADWPMARRRRLEAVAC